MIKSQFITALADRMTHLSERMVARSVNQILEEITEALTSGRRIEIRGFGSFNIHERAPRNAHNPKTGEKVRTKRRKSAHFKPGKELRERVNQASVPLQRED